MKCACKPLATPTGIPTRMSIQRVKDAPTRDASHNIKYADDANWQTVGSRMAWVKTLGGSERLSSDQLQAGHTHKVTFRSDRTTRAITPTYRLQFEQDGETKTISVVSAVDKDFQRQWVECVGVETRA
jgi:head-tail adaptor